MLQLIHDVAPGATLKFISSGSPIGRSFVVRKDVPADRLALLKTAFRDTVNDPLFLKEAAALNANIDPTEGEVLDALVAETLQTPSEIIRLASEAIATGRKMQVKCMKNCKIPKKKK